MSAINEVTTAKEQWAEWAKDWAPEFMQEGDAWSARLTFRQVWAQGKTKEEALAALTRIYCELSRDGSFNPKRPHHVGAPPIQHAIEILQELLAFHTSCRYDDWREQALQDEAAPRESGQDEATAGGNYTRDPRFARRNEVISGLATSIAALARVKEL